MFFGSSFGIFVSYLPAGDESWASVVCPHLVPVLRPFVEMYSGYVRFVSGFKVAFLILCGGSFKEVAQF